MHNSVEILEFTRIFNLYKVKLYNYVLKMIREKLSAEDIVQNVFLSFYNNIHLIKNKGSINFWLFRTARNEVLMYHRKKRTHKDQFYVDDADELDIKSEYDLEDVIEKKEIKTLINKELENIPTEQREVFLLREYGGLSYSEIASVMEIDEKLVKSRLFKTREKLINKLSDIIRH